MKSIGFDAGNINLKGKRTHLHGCGCCVVQNLRPKVRDIEHLKEMRAGTVVQDDLYDEDYAEQYEDSEDRGGWSLFFAGDDKVGIQSSDFNHDVVMYVTGDFAGLGEKIRYAQNIADRLNCDYR